VGNLGQRDQPADGAEWRPCERQTDHEKSRLRQLFFIFLPKLEPQPQVLVALGFLIELGGVILVVRSAPTRYW
jgi:hypothetical protein